VALATVVSVQPLPAKSGPTQWVGTWASAPMLDTHAKNAEELVGATASSGVTLREIVHVSIGGDMVRVRFSNLYGTGPLLIGGAEIAKTLQGAAIVPGTGVALTFHGKPSISIPPGALVVSDPAAFKLAPLSNLTVSFYLPSPSGPVTMHLFGDTTNYRVADNAVASADLQALSTFTSWYYLNGVDTLAPPNGGAVVTLGDSITDGAQSTLDVNQRWPDELARRMQADPKYRQLAVLNEGIGGNQILRDGTGPNALARFDRDVIAQSGAKYLFILEGINDIGHLYDGTNAGLTAADLIGALNQMIVRAHAHGMVVIGCTLTPYHGASHYTDNGEAIRKAVNDWIRNSGAFDGVVDFEAAVRDPKHPDTFLPADDPGDHLHPNDAGYKEMGDAIDLKLLTLKPKQP
jgi:lysophospholipase L1-like esterase